MHHSMFTGSTWVQYNKKPCYLKSSTYMALLSNKIVEHAGYLGGNIEIYQLTEKYRNVVRSNPQAAYYAKLAKQEVIKRSGMSNSEIVKVSTQPKKIKK